MGFPSPVLEFFVLGVCLFLVGAVTLGRNIEDVTGIEAKSLQQRQRERDTTPSED